MAEVPRTPTASAKAQARKRAYNEVPYRLLGGEEKMAKPDFDDGSLPISSEQLGRSTAKFVRRPHNQHFFTAAPPHLQGRNDVKVSEKVPLYREAPIRGMRPGLTHLSAFRGSEVEESNDGKTSHRRTVKIEYQTVRGNLNITS